MTSVHRRRVGALEWMSMTAANLRETLESSDVLRKTGSGSRRADDHSHPSFADGSTVEPAARRDIRRRPPGDRERDLLLGRTSAGTPGDADAGGHGVAEGAHPRPAPGMRGGASHGSGASAASPSPAALSEQRRIAAQLSATTEHVCRCSDGGDQDEFKGGCRAACRMAERNRERVDAAARKTEPRRDWAGDLA